MRLRLSQVAQSGATTDQAAVWDGAQWSPASLAAAVAATYPFSATGALAVTVGSHRLYNDGAASRTITSVRASVGTSPAGASVLVDVNLDGVTIFTTQANRPAVPAAGTSSGKVTSMSFTVWPVGSYLSVDVDQVGSTTPGSDLTVQVEVG